MIPAGAGLMPSEAGADHRQGIGYVEKGIGLLFGQDFLNAEVTFPPLVVIKGCSPLFDQRNPSPGF